MNCSFETERHKFLFSFLFEKKKKNVNNPQGYIERVKVFTDEVGIELKKIKQSHYRSGEAQNLPGI